MSSTLWLRQGALSLTAGHLAERHAVTVQVMSHDTQASRQIVLKTPQPAEFLAASLTKCASSSQHVADAAVAVLAVTTQGVLHTWTIDAASLLAAAQEQGGAGLHPRQFLHVAFETVEEANDAAKPAAAGPPFSRAQVTHASFSQCGSVVLAFSSLDLCIVKLQAAPLPPGSSFKSLLQADQCVWDFHLMWLPRDQREVLPLPAESAVASTGGAAAAREEQDNEAEGAASSSAALTAASTSAGGGGLFSSWMGRLLEVPKMLLTGGTTAASAGSAGSASSERPEGAAAAATAGPQEETSNARASAQDEEEEEAMAPSTPPPAPALMRNSSAPASVFSASASGSSQWASSLPQMLALAAFSWPSALSAPAVPAAVGASVAAADSLAIASLLSNGQLRVHRVQTRTGHGRVAIEASFAALAARAKGLTEEEEEALDIQELAAAAIAPVLRAAEPSSTGAAGAGAGAGAGAAQEDSQLFLTADGDAAMLLSATAVMRGSGHLQRMVVLAGLSIPADAITAAETSTLPAGMAAAAVPSASRPDLGADFSFLASLRSPVDCPLASSAAALLSAAAAAGTGSVLASHASPAIRAVSFACLESPLYLPSSLLVFSSEVATLDMLGKALGAQSSTSDSAIGLGGGVGGGLVRSGGGLTHQLSAGGGSIAASSSLRRAAATLWNPAAAVANAAAAAAWQLMQQQEQQHVSSLALVHHSSGAIEEASLAPTAASLAAAPSAAENLLMQAASQLQLQLPFLLPFATSHPKPLSSALHAAPASLFIPQFLQRPNASAIVQQKLQVLAAEHREAAARRAEAAAAAAQLHSSNQLDAELSVLLQEGKENLTPRKRQRSRSGEKAVHEAAAAAAGMQALSLESAATAKFAGPAQQLQLAFSVLAQQELSEEGVPTLIKALAAGFAVELLPALQQQVELVLRGNHQSAGAAAAPVAASADELLRDILSSAVELRANMAMALHASTAPPNPAGVPRSRQMSIGSVSAASESSSVTPSRSKGRRSSAVRFAEGGGAGPSSPLLGAAGGAGSPSPLGRHVFSPVSRLARAPSETATELSEGNFTRRSSTMLPPTYTPAQAEAVLQALSPEAQWQLTLLSLAETWKRAFLDLSQLAETGQAAGQGMAEAVAAAGGQWKQLLVTFSSAPSSSSVLQRSSSGASASLSRTGSAHAAAGAVAHARFLAVAASGAMQPLAFVSAQSSVGRGSSSNALALHASFNPSAVDLSPLPALLDRGFVEPSEHQRGLYLSALQQLLPSPRVPADASFAASSSTSNSLLSAAASQQGQLPLARLLLALSSQTSLDTAHALAVRLQPGTARDGADGASKPPSSSSSSSTAHSSQAATELYNLQQMLRSGALGFASSAAGSASAASAGGAAASSASEASFAAAGAGAQRAALLASFHQLLDASVIGQIASALQVQQAVVAGASAGGAAQQLSASSQSIVLAGQLLLQLLPLSLQKSLSSSILSMETGSGPASAQLLAPLLSEMAHLTGFDGLRAQAAAASGAAGSSVTGAGWQQLLQGISSSYTELLAEELAEIASSSSSAGPLRALVSSCSASPAGAATVLSQEAASSAWLATVDCTARSLAAGGVVSDGQGISSFLDGLKYQVRAAKLAAAAGGPGAAAMAARRAALQSPLSRTASVGGAELAGGSTLTAAQQQLMRSRTAGAAGTSSPFRSRRATVATGTTAGDAAATAAAGGGVAPKRLQVMQTEGGSRISFTSVGEWQTTALYGLLHRPEAMLELIGLNMGWQQLGSVGSGSSTAAAGSAPLHPKDLLLSSLSASLQAKAGVSSSSSSGSATSNELSEGLAVACSLLLTATDSSSDIPALLQVLGPRAAPFAAVTLAIARSLLKAAGFSRHALSTAAQEMWGKVAAEAAASAQKSGNAQSAVTTALAQLQPALLGLMLLDAAFKPASSLGLLLGVFAAPAGAGKNSSSSSFALFTVRSAAARLAWLSSLPAAPSSSVQGAETTLKMLAGAPAVPGAGAAGGAKLHSLSVDSSSASDVASLVFLPSTASVPGAAAAPHHHFPALQLLSKLHLSGGQGEGEDAASQPAQGLIGSLQKALSATGIAASAGDFVQQLFSLPSAGLSDSAAALQRLHGTALAALHSSSAGGGGDISLRMFSARGSSWRDYLASSLPHAAAGGAAAGGRGAGGAQPAIDPISTALLCMGQLPALSSWASSITGELLEAASGSSGSSSVPALLMHQHSYLHLLGMVQLVQAAQQRDRVLALVEGSATSSANAAADASAGAAGNALEVATTVAAAGQAEGVLLSAAAKEDSHSSSSYAAAALLPLLLNRNLSGSRSSSGSLVTLASAFASTLSPASLAAATPLLPAKMAMLEQLQPFVQGEMMAAVKQQKQVKAEGGMAGHAGTAVAAAAPADAAFSPAVLEAAAGYLSSLTLSTALMKQAHKSLAAFAAASSTAAAAASSAASLSAATGIAVEGEEEGLTSQQLQQLQEKAGLLLASHASFTAALLDNCGLPLSKQLSLQWSREAAAALAPATAAVAASAAAPAGMAAILSKLAGALWQHVFIRAIQDRDVLSAALSSGSSLAAARGMGMGLGSSSLFSSGAAMDGFSSSVGGPGGLGGLGGEGGAAGMPPPLLRSPLHLLQGLSTALLRLRSPDFSLAIAAMTNNPVKSIHAVHSGELISMLCRLKRFDILSSEEALCRNEEVAGQVVSALKALINSSVLQPLPVSGLKALGLLPASLASPSAAAAAASLSTVFSRGELEAGVYYAAAAAAAAAQPAGQQRQYGGLRTLQLSQESQEMWQPRQGLQTELHMKLQGPAGENTGSTAEYVCVLYSHLAQSGQHAQAAARMWMLATDLFRLLQTELAGMKRKLPAGKVLATADKGSSGQAAHSVMHATASAAQLLQQPVSSNTLLSSEAGAAYFTTLYPEAAAALLQLEEERRKGSTEAMQAQSERNKLHLPETILDAVSAHAVLRASTAALTLCLQSLLQLPVEDRFVVLQAPAQLHCELLPLPSMTGATGTTATATAGASATVAAGATGLHATGLSLDMSSEEAAAEQMALQQQESLRQLSSVRNAATWQDLLGPGMEAGFGGAEEQLLPAALSLQPRKQARSAISVQQQGSSAAAHLPISGVSLLNQTVEEGAVHLAFCALQAQQQLVQQALDRGISAALRSLTASKKEASRSAMAATSAAGAAAALPAVGFVASSAEMSELFSVLQEGWAGAMEAILRVSPLHAPAPGMPQVLPLDSLLLLCKSLDMQQLQLALIEQGSYVKAFQLATLCQQQQQTQQQEQQQQRGGAGEPFFPPFLTQQQVLSALAEEALQTQWASADIAAAAANPDTTAAAVKPLKKASARAGKLLAALDDATLLTGSAERHSAAAAGTALFSVTVPCLPGEAAAAATAGSAGNVGACSYRLWALLQTLLPQLLQAEEKKQHGSSTAAAEAACGIIGKILALSTVKGCVAPVPHWLYQTVFSRDPAALLNCYLAAGAVKEATQTAIAAVQQAMSSISSFSQQAERMERQQARGFRCMIPIASIRRLQGSLRDALASGDYSAAEGAAAAAAGGGAAGSSSRPAESASPSLSLQSLADELDGLLQRYLEQQLPVLDQFLQAI